MCVCWIRRKLSHGIRLMRLARLCRARWQASVVDSIGSTPLIELQSLSRATGSTILAKCEHLNPGGSVKDRAARWIVEAAEREGLLRPGDCVVDGGGGNTGIGLGMVAAAKGYKSVHFVPQSTSVAKTKAMRMFDTEVILTPSVPFTDPRHYFHQASELAQQSGFFFTNQFENVANSQAHYESTGPELWKEADGQLDGFICSCGTGGTIGGIANYLKEVNPKVACWIIDAPGSALEPLVAAGPTYATEGTSPSSNRTRYLGDRKVRFAARSAAGIDGVFEGIGIDRITTNFSRAFDAGGIDGAIKGTEKEAVDMAYYLKRSEGIAVGPSAALNVVGAVRLAVRLGRGSTVATVLCDGAERYSDKLLDSAWLSAKGLEPHPGEAGEFLGF